MKSLSHANSYVIFFLTFFKRNQAAFIFFAVYNHFLNTLLNVIRVLDFDVVNSIAECSGKCEITKSFRDTWVDTQSVVGWLNTQDSLRQVPESPCCSTCQPAVLCLTMENCVSACNHLRIYIWFRTVDFADIFDVGRAGLLVNLKSSVAASDDGFCDRNPWIIVTEDTCVLFISRRIGGNFSKVQIILGIGRLKDHNTVFGIQTLFDRIQSLLSHRFLP